MKTAEAVRRRLREARLLDPTLAVERRGDAVAFPVTDGRAAQEAVRGLGARTVRLEDPVPTGRRTPRERVQARLRDRLPADLLEALPRGWTLVGDVVVLDLPPELEDHGAAVGRAMAEVLGAKAVLAEGAGIAGELRRPRGRRFLHGDDARTVHVENGIRYELDLTRVMWSAGNVDERVRMARVDARGEAVADLFAGVGYFTLPLAVHGGARRVLACEKNPVAHGFLKANARRNGVEDAVVPVLGDNRDLTSDGIRALGVSDDGLVDRVVLGYLPGTHRFLPHALALLRPGGVVHYHDTFGDHEADAGPRERLAEAAATHDRGVEVLGVRTVKSYAPGVHHVVADARVT